MTGAALIREVEGAVGITDSDFIDNQARSRSGGRIISLDNDNDTHIYPHMWAHFERVQTELAAYVVVVIVVVVMLYDLCAHIFHLSYLSFVWLWQALLTLTILQDL